MKRNKWGSFLSNPTIKHTQKGSNPNNFIFEWVKLTFELFYRKKNLLLLCVCVQGTRLSFVVAIVQLLQILIIITTTTTEQYCHLLLLLLFHQERYNWHSLLMAKYLERKKCRQQQQTSKKTLIFKKKNLKVKETKKKWQTQRSFRLEMKNLE